MDLNQFERSVRETELWLRDIETLFPGSRQHAYPALRATLCVLRDWLPVEVSRRFAGGLPEVLGAIFLAGRSTFEPRDPNSDQEFAQRISEQLGPEFAVDAATVGNAVLEVVRSRIGLTEFRKILAYLPKVVRQVWLQDSVCVGAQEVEAAGRVLNGGFAPPCRRHSGMLDFVVSSARQVALAMRGDAGRGESTGQDVPTNYGHLSVAPRAAWN